MTLEKVGLKHHVVKSGKFKTISPHFSSLDSEERKIYQDIVDSVAGQFNEVLLQERGISPEMLTLVTDGRVFTGQQALEMNLIDSLGGLQEAIQMAAKLAGIKHEPHVIHLERPPVNLWSSFLRSKIGGALPFSLKW